MKTKKIAKTKEKKETTVKETESIDIVREFEVLEKIDPFDFKPSEKKQMYELWLSLPAMLRLLPDSEKEKMGYSVEDPIFQRLLSIKSQRDFCSTFGVSSAQPQRWLEADPNMEIRAADSARREHALKYLKDIDFSFTQKVLKHGDAQRVKLWYQIMTGWTEKTEVKNTNLNVDIVSLVQEIEARNAKIREN